MAPANERDLKLVHLEAESSEAEFTGLPSEVKHRVVLQLKVNFFIFSRLMNYKTPDLVFKMIPPVCVF